MNGADALTYISTPEKVKLSNVAMATEWLCPVIKKNSFATYAKSMFQASSSGVKEDSTSLYPDRP